LVYKSADLASASVALDHLTWKELPPPPSPPLPPCQIPTSSPLHPLQAQLHYLLLFLFLLLCQLMLLFNPFISNLLRLLNRSTLPPFEYNFLLLLF